MFPSAAETTLSSSPTTAPRISTSSSDVTEGDVRRVIWQDPASSPNRVLAGSGVGRGAAKGPAKQSTGRGQGLAGMLVDRARRAGRGQSAPLATHRGGQDKEKDRQALVPSLDLPQRSQCSWIVRVLWLPTWRPPLGHLRELEPTPLRLTSGDVHLKLAAHEKEKEAARATLE